MTPVRLDPAAPWSPVKHSTTEPLPSQRKKYNIWEIITFDLSIYTMNHPDLTVSNFMENSIGLKRAK